MALSWILYLLLTSIPLTAEVTLIDAVKQKDVSAVRTLLQKRVDVNAPEGDGATALHWAAYKGDVQMVDLLINAGAKVNQANDLKITPLYLASANGDAAVVERLLKAGAFADAASEAGVTPLMEAARSGSAAAVRALLAHEANVNNKEHDRQQTALMWAAAQRHPDAVKALLEHGADIKARTRVRNLTVMLDNGSRGVKTSRENATQLDFGGYTAMFFAAQSGDAESIKLLLAAGTDANDTAADGNTALLLATFNGNGPVVPILLEAGADSNAAGAGYTALHAAALRGDLAAVKALLAKGANPNAQITKGSPVRRFGAQWTLPSTLIGATPLLVASTYLEVDIVRTLTAAGANPMLGLPSGINPLLAATGPALERPRPSDLQRWSVPDTDTPSVPRDEKDTAATTGLLLDAGADVNSVSGAGDTPLHTATAAGMTSVIQLLADRGAKLDQKNRNGQTPLAMASGVGGRGQRGGGGGGNPEAQARTKAVADLLRKLGATP